MKAFSKNSSELLICVVALGTQVAQGHYAVVPS